MTRSGRMKWWTEARFGMFVHWGLYSVLGRHEWVMNRERIPVKQYEQLADKFRPKRGAPAQWARLAQRAGMKYMVMTTKHHEGFCLWDTAQTDFNSVARGPHRDLVREYVEAAREFGLKVGFYYSLMDWRHPDGARCATDSRARRRFLDFTKACVRELTSNYGKIDILWYDLPWPLRTPELWESRKMNAMVRKAQPHIIINNRCRLDEDFGTPEEHVRPAAPGRAWEACMTLNGSCGYFPSIPDEDWRSVRDILNMLRQAAAGNGNLLLNIGPAPDGSVPSLAIERLRTVGRWLERNGEAVYGRANRTDGRFDWTNLGGWTLKDKTAYFWCTRWVGREIAIGGIRGKLRSASFLHNGRKVKFRQDGQRLILHSLPANCPDRIAGIVVIKMRFDRGPRQVLGPGCVVLRRA